MYQVKRSRRRIGSFSRQGPFALLFFFLISPFALALSGTGPSGYPLKVNGRLVGAELTGRFSQEEGLGLQTRYTQKLSSLLTFDAGIGISGGGKGNRLFSHFEYEIFPDYMNQPKVSSRLGVEFMNGMGEKERRLSLSPLISKGLNVYGQEVFPFVSLPIGLSFQQSSKTYASFTNLNLGFVGNLPFRGQENIVGNIEGTWDMRKGNMEIFLGASYPLL